MTPDDEREMMLMRDHIETLTTVWQLWKARSFVTEELLLAACQLLREAVNWIDDEEIGSALTDGIDGLLKGVSDRVTA